MSFFSNSFLWLDVVIAAALSAAAVGVVGVHAIVRRVVFLPAALSQLAGLGVVIAFIVAALVPALSASILTDPRLYAMVCAASGALLLGLMGEGRGMTRDWVLGSVYISSSALIVLAANYIPHEIHDVNDILLGNAITIERSQMLLTAVLSCLVLVLHGALARPFMATAFDAQTALAHGVPVRSLNVMLFISMGLATAMSTRVVGALPAFAFALFPGATALRLARDARVIIVLAAILGALDAFFGYWASFVFSWPTGACMAALSMVLYFVVIGLKSSVQLIR